MRITLNLLGGLLAFGWAGVAADYATGIRHERMLDEQPPFPPDASDAPALSVVLAACNEEDKLPAAFRSLLAQDYPGPFEIVAVDDRSTDSTPALLDSLAAEARGADKQVVILHLTQLPPGWLGKTHALYRGAHRATGCWILFTDADIHFAPDTLSRAVRYAEAQKLDHLVSFFRLDLRGFWEKVFGLCFSFFFTLRFRAWAVRDPKSKAYLGVGGFNMIRREAYDGIGTHRALALEVADDMELGRRVKVGGYRSEVVGSAGLITVRWQEGLGGLMGGLTKNAYAGLGYSPWVLLRSVSLLLLTVLGPVVGLVAARDRVGRGVNALSVALLVALGAHHARRAGIPAGYALALPLSSLLLCAVMFRSAYVTEKNGGITWRGTFYPLAELRARAIPTLPDAL